MVGREPSDEMVCPECEANTSKWTPVPYNDTAEGFNFHSTVVVPYRCECGANFEVVYAADEIAH